MVHLTAAEPSVTSRSAPYMSTNQPKAAVLQSEAPEHPTYFAIPEVTAAAANDLPPILQALTAQAGDNSGSATRSAPPTAFAKPKRKAETVVKRKAKSRKADSDGSQAEEDGDCSEDEYEDALDIPRPEDAGFLDNAGADSL